METVRIFRVSREIVVGAPNTAEVCEQDVPLWEAQGWRSLGCVREEKMLPPPVVDYAKPASVDTLEERDDLSRLGLGPKATRALYDAGYHTFVKLKIATDSELLAVDGIGKIALVKMRDALVEV